MTRSDYQQEITELATDILDNSNSDDDYYDAVHETVDGHEWIIYYAHNTEVIQHTDNASAYEDVYSSEDLGDLVKDKGVLGLNTMIAYFAMAQDLLEEINSLRSTTEAKENGTY